MAILILLGFTALVALPSVLWLYALVDAIINNFKTLAAKIIWVIVLCLFPPLGTLLYYLVGRNQRVTYYPVGRLVLFAIFLFPLLMVIGYILYSFGHLTFILQPPDLIQI